MFLSISDILPLEHFFYKRVPYGSEAQFGPATLFFNGAFDFLRNGNVPRKIQDIRFHNGLKQLNKSLEHPINTAYTFQEDTNISFWVHQCFPKSLDKKSAAWIPNFQSHLLGEGMLTRKVAEWYDSHRYPYPYFMGIATAAFFQYTNEVIEISPYNKASIDPIADIYLFNTAGYLLFAINPVSRFFSEKIKTNCWLPQAVISPDGSISNAGELYVMKFNLPFTSKYQGLYCWGNDGILGISYKGENQKNYSFGFGQKASKLMAENNLQTQITPNMEPFFAFFLDKNESLLLSINQTGYNKVNSTLNIYPGFLNSKLGLYTSYKKTSHLEIGITYIHSPIGLQY